jgi:hypothetical protein
MDKARLDDALSSMTRRDLEELREEIARRLVVCVVCGQEGADTLKVSGTGQAKGKVAAIMICRPCFEKHRLPEGRAGAAPTP